MYYRRAFTLIEVLIVIAILGILGVLVVPKIMHRPDEARMAAVKIDIQTLINALKLYHLDNGHYPTTTQGLQALVKKPDTLPTPQHWQPYLDKLPKDPWGNPYYYRYPGIKGEIDVFSYGANGIAGGEGRDADIGSWML